MNKKYSLVLLLLLIVMASSAQWALTGNLATNEATNFVGTTDARDVRFRTDNTFRMVLTKTTGRLGLGVAAPTSIFHISTTATGDVFKSDGPTANANRWQLFTSGTERFRIRTFANSFDTWLERTQVGSEADIRLLTAQVEIRARNKRLGDFNEFAGAFADEVTLGDQRDVKTIK